MKIEKVVKMPLMPNFLSYESEPRPRQEGFKTASFDIGMLTEKEAHEFAGEWKVAFLNHWKNRRDLLKQNSEPA